VLLEKSCSTRSFTGCIVPPASITERAAATTSRNGADGLRSMNLKWGIVGASVLVAVGKEDEEDEEEKIVGAAAFAAEFVLLPEVAAVEF